jgi:hypothetical protein
MKINNATIQIVYPIQHEGETYNWVVGVFVSPMLSFVKSSYCLEKHQNFYRATKKSVLKRMKKEAESNCLVKFEDFFN